MGLDCLTYRPVWDLCPINVKCLPPTYENIFWINLIVSGKPFSDKTLAGTPKLNSKSLMSIVVTAIAVVFVFEVGFESFESLSFITVIFYLRDVFSKSDQSYIATNCSGSFGGNKPSFVYLFFRRSLSKLEFISCTIYIFPREISRAHVI